MVSSISINPALSTNAGGSFATSFDGLMQGTAFPDPAARYGLAGGFLSNSESLPMWGGVGISELIPDEQGSPATTPDPSIGGGIRRATNISTVGAALSLTGFSVFDQAYGMINSPQSPVPLAASSGQVMFYRLGSGARIAVAIDPALVSLEGDIITSQVSWDFAEQRLIPYNAAYPANALLSQSWASTGGGTVTASTTTSHGVAVGSDFTISGSAPDGYNGTHKAIAGTTGDVLKWASADPGSSTVLGTLVAGGGALPVKIIKIQATNCMVVSYDSDTGYATWNRNGAAAVIEI